MNDTNTRIQKTFFGRQLYMYLSLVIAVPIWLMIHAYVNTIDVHEDEAVATGATAFFIFGVFAGRYIAQLWTLRVKTIQPGKIALLVIIIVVCISWLFFHADFPLKKRAAINLLLFWLPFMAISIAIGILIKMLRAVTQYQLNEARMAAAHSKTELHLLQSQLSPHFLFNTLNNIYGLSITQQEKVPPLLLKLSELLRYSVYDAGEIYVPLQDEIAYINNYIEFEKIRIGDRLVLKVDLQDVQSSTVKIAPMLLIIFIENAFKHAKNSAEEKIFIEIALKTWGHSILFSVSNSQVKPKPDNSVANKSSGFGMVSVNKRLALLYPGEHELSIQNEETFYNVLLQLKIK